ncbi:MAG: Flagellar synthesis regulatory protein FlaF [uncultured Microvirga sp.]|uniref:Flagellar synthesis regulatory protein FlaF n=1 Tax=uncultured Microvirga sp. TaxID=412392 RepID=A0A6J4L5R8_9HYPH|nr:MAG: Flagellar synthesis regulatory protein FlaF [uncultured Microvirga sp.]
MAQATHSPRELEAAILIRAAARLQAIRDDWAGKRPDLEDALTYNRKLWTILVSSATEAANPLPVAIKQNVANLGIFVFNHTIALISEPKPEGLAVLVSINRELAAGLRSQPQAAA